MNLNILNPKALEKQLKILDSKLQELQKEMDALERMRTACLVLMGNDVDFASPKINDAPAVAVSDLKSSKTGKPATRYDLKAELVSALEAFPEGLSAERLVEELGAKKIPVGGKQPASTLLALLKKSSDTFEETSGGRWVLFTGAAVAHDDLSAEDNESWEEDLEGPSASA